MIHTLGIFIFKYCISQIFLQNVKKKEKKMTFDNAWQISIWYDTTLVTWLRTVIAGSGKSTHTIKLSRTNSLKDAWQRPHLKQNAQSRRISQTTHTRPCKSETPYVRLPLQISAYIPTIDSGECALIVNKHNILILLSQIYYQIRSERKLLATL